MSGEPTIAVIGAGPAGLMAAETIAGALGRAASVVVLDHMAAPGRKFLMAGRGGLNLTHSEPLDRFIPRYGAEAARMGGVLDSFGPAALRQWCEELGEATFVGSSGRVFPSSFKASPLLRAWLRRLERQGVALRLRSRFLGWNDEGRLRIAGPGGETNLRADAVVLALGGASWPRLGSDGSWVAMLRERGVPVRTLVPANMGFRVAWSPVFAERFAGVPLKGVALSIDGASARGEAMVSAWGLEGGAVYAISGPLRDACAARGSATLGVDLKPELTLERVEERLMGGKAGQSLSNRLRKALALPPVAVGLLREASPGGLPQDPAGLARLVKAAEIPVLGPGPIERAISSAGGIAWDALSPELMITALPGVFAAGEMIDWEAPTGGYLLQACFATGVVAGRGAAAFVRAGGLARETSVS